jgi:ABC transport system ATP-binding/permease protein
VVTQSLVAQGEGIWKEYAGGYSDWLVQRAAADESATALRPAAGLPAVAPSGAQAGPAPRTSKSARQRLSYMERRELDALPARIESLEKEEAELHASMATADYHRRGAVQIQQDRARLQQIETELASCFERWAELESRGSAAGS